MILIWLVLNRLPIGRLARNAAKKHDNLPDPDVLAQEVVAELEAALEQFRKSVGDLGGEVTTGMA